ncbi:MAG: preprotein translocase subunit SecG [Puniceicoccales bacterium]|nr:preprotein translocase subunit SecG [Puniceicoccales bacterium]
MMLNFLIGVGSVFLVALCAWLILLILMQKPSANAGMGAALGGGVAESAFGGEASNVLVRWTVYGIVAFFLTALLLTLCQIPKYHKEPREKELKPMVVETPAGALTQLPAVQDNANETP